MRIFKKSRTHHSSKFR